MENQPNFIHDCDQCEFLGHTSKGNDVWFCQGRWHSLIIRYSSEGADYHCIYPPRLHTQDLDGKKHLYSDVFPEYIEAWKMKDAKGYRTFDEQNGEKA